MKRPSMVLGVVFLLLAVAAAPATATDPPYLLDEGTWVCSTPAAYDQAIIEQKKTNGYQELTALKDQQLADKLCMFVDDDDIEDMMAPFVEVIERQGDMVKVTFTVEFYKRHAMLHRSFSRVKFSGWTSEDRLADYRPVSG